MWFVCLSAKAVAWNQTPSEAAVILPTRTAHGKTMAILRLQDLRAQREIIWCGAEFLNFAGRSVTPI